MLIFSIFLSSFFPSSDYIIESKYIISQEDTYFRDLTISHLILDVNQNSDQNCCIRLCNCCDNMGKITRIESFSFTLKDMHYFPIIIKFVVLLVILVYICISFNKSIKEILINGSIALLYCIIVALYSGYCVF